MHVKKRLPHSSLGNRSPFELFISKKPSLNHVIVFSCAELEHNNHPKSKLHCRAIPGIHLGGKRYAVYILECLLSEIVIHSSHVTFDEFSFPRLKFQVSSSEEESESESSLHNYY